MPNILFWNLIRLTFEDYQLRINTAAFKKEQNEILERSRRKQALFDMDEDEFDSLPLEEREKIDNICLADR